MIDEEFSGALLEKHGFLSKRESIDCLTSIVRPIVSKSLCFPYGTRMDSICSST